MSKMQFMAVLSILSCGAAGAPDVGASLRAAQRAAVDTPARVVRIAVFKNGFGFVFRQADVQAGSTVRIDDAPRAVLGTLWAYPAEGDVDVRSFRAVEGKASEDRDCASLGDLLRSSVGKRVRLSRTSETGVETAEGTIARAVGDDLFLLQTQDAAAASGFLAFSASQFDTVVFLDEPGEQCTAEVDRAQLVVDVGGSGAGKIEYTALEEGLKWVPEYRVERIADDEVRVTLQGVLVNDVVDLEDVGVDLVVGVPHYLMSGTLSPMVIQATLEDVAEAAYLQTGAQWARRENFSNAMQAQASGPWVESAGGGDAAADMGGVDVADADELTLYHVDHVTLGKGERSLIRIFSAEVPVEDIYKWEIAGTEADAEGVRSRAMSGDRSAVEQLARQRVWHHLRLSNRTSLPWTTGPAVAFEGGNVVAQDMITYTPAGAGVDLKLTVATDVLVEWNDTQDERRRAAMEVDDVYYDLIAGHGELTIRSHEDRPIELVVVRRMLGTISDPTDSGRVHTDPGEGGGWSSYSSWGGYGYGYGYGYDYGSYDWNMRRLNSPVWCEWKIRVGADSEKTLGYRFRYYTR